MTKKRPQVRSPMPDMYPYTVVLLRPEYLGEFTTEQYGQDIYVAQVTASSVGAALRAAQKEVFAADTRDGLAPVSREDYKLCVLFDEHCDPRAFGWQV